MINETVNNGFRPPTQLRADAPRSPEAETSGGGGVRVLETVAQSLRNAHRSPSQTAEERNPPDREQLEEAVSRLNDHVQNLRRTLSFRVEESTGRTVIEVYDSETEELIRQIPPEETLRLAEAIEGESPGLFLKERA